MFAVDEHNLGFAVQTVFFVVCVIDEAGFVAVACGVDDPIAVEVEEKGEEFAVVDNAAALGFGGRDNLVTVNILSFEACNLGKLKIGKSGKCLPRQRIHLDSHPFAQVPQRIIRSQRLQAGFHPSLVSLPLRAGGRYFDSRF
jgi:hypothetical protein